MTYHYVNGNVRSHEYKNWIYAWTMQRQDRAPDAAKPYAAIVYKPKNVGTRRNPDYEVEQHKITWFAKRSTAQRSATRAYEAHQKRIAQQAELRAMGYIAPGILCPKCEQRKKVKGDYLCEVCRGG